MSKWRLVPLLIACMLLGGCWDRGELDDIGIVSALGIDWKDDKWQVSYQIVMPLAISNQSSSGGMAAGVNVFTTSGETLRETRSKASKEMSRRIYFGHNQVIVIGQAAARKGLEPVFEIYLRNIDSRETVSVFLAKGSARRMLEQLIPLGKIPGATIQRLIENEEENESTFAQMSMHQVLSGLLSSSQTVGIPRLALSGSNESVDKMEMLSQTHTPSKVKLVDLGLIHKDKLIGWISAEESKGVMWLANRIKRTTVNFSCVQGDEGRKDSTISIQHAGTRLAPKQQPDGKWLMQVHSKASGMLTEYNCEAKWLDPGNIRQLERQIEKEITALLENGWRAVRKEKADILNFGSSIYRTYPGAWQKMKDEWPTHFAQMEVEIKVEVDIQGTGHSHKSFKEAQAELHS